MNKRNIYITVIKILTREFSNGVFTYTIKWAVQSNWRITSLAGKTYINIIIGHILFNRQYFNTSHLITSVNTYVYRSKIILLNYPNKDKSHYIIIIVELLMNNLYLCNKYYWTLYYKTKCYWSDNVIKIEYNDKVSVLTSGRNDLGPYGQ